MIGFHDVWNKFGINAFVGGNAMKKWYEGMQLNGSNFIIPFLHTPSNISNKNYDYWYHSKGINSFFGSLELGWDGYLYLTATARNDWFSTLDPEHNSIFLSFRWFKLDIFGIFFNARLV